MTEQARLDSGLADDAEAAAAYLGCAETAAGYLSALEPGQIVSRGTTHISVIDAEGNAAAVTLSNGEGCGDVIVPAGCMLNNMLGEQDLNPHGFHRWQPGRRLSSMMAPTVVHAGNRALIALGSGGSNRIRSAILQVLLNLLDFGMSPEDAVAAPRLHLEGGMLDIEAGPDARAIAAAARWAQQCAVWPEQNFYFGGVHAVQRMPDGSVAGAGDLRRGGVARSTRGGSAA